MSQSVKFAEALNEKFEDANLAFSTEYIVTFGSKYDRIVQQTAGAPLSASVHAFLDKEGNLYKPAGWKGPAAGIRFTADEVMTKAVAVADRYGNYLARR